MGRRSSCCDKVGVKKGPWTPEEDRKLFSYVQQHGHGSWKALPPKAGLRRCGKSCRLRWINYLRPDIKRGKFSLQEEQTIIQLHALLGNRWSAIASHLAKRTDNEIKNYWNTHLKKRLTKMGIDPTTHKPMNQTLIHHPKDLSHMAQWETARLQAEARIVRQSKLALSSPTYCYRSQLSTNKAAAAPPPPPPPPPPLSRPPCLDILKVWQGMMTTCTNPSFFAPDHNDVGLIHIENALFASDHDNYAGHYSAVAKTSSDDCWMKGTLMENPSLLPDLLEDDLMIPPSIARDNVAGHCDNVVFFEENNKVNFWSSILNVASSPPMDSPMF